MTKASSYHHQRARALPLTLATLALAAVLIASAVAALVPSAAAVQTATTVPANGSHSSKGNCATQTGQPGCLACSSPKTKGHSKSSTPKCTKCSTPAYVPTPNSSGKCTCAAGYGHPPFPKPPKTVAAHGHGGGKTPAPKKPYACEPCPPMSVSPPSSDKCSFCPANFRPNDDRSACVPICTPKTCAALGATCGSTSDTCGHFLQCGSCTVSTQTCQSNVCACPEGETLVNGVCQGGGVVVTCTQSGTQPSDDLTRCVCINGFFGTNGGPNDCQPCGDGAFNVGIGNTGCQCKISGQEWTPNQCSCPAGQVVIDNKCQKPRTCPAGSSFDSQGNCVCDSGFINASTGQAPCDKCPDGANTGGKTGQKACVCTAPHTVWTDGKCVCQPQTCSELGASCGLVNDDGCGGELSCGDCAAGMSCSAAHQCVPACQPKSCWQLNAACGSLDDGCGSLVQCGDCAAGTTCSAARECVSVCAADEVWDPAKSACVLKCQPKTCAQLNAACGSLDDGQPKTCAQLGFNCGTVNDDGCGGRLDCGGCDVLTETCLSNKCEPNISNVCDGIDGARPDPLDPTTCICTLNFYGALGKPPCWPCLGGSFTAAPGQSVCQCPNNQIWDSVNNLCTCSPGDTLVNGVCVSPCPPNTFSVNGLGPDCTPCVADSTSKAGSTKCKCDREPFQTWDPTINKCVCPKKCPKGYACELDGDAAQCVGVEEGVPCINYGGHDSKSGCGLCVRDSGNETDLVCKAYGFINPGAGCAANASLGGGRCGKGTDNNTLVCCVIEKLNGDHFSVPPNEDGLCPVVTNPFPALLPRRLKK